MKTINRCDIDPIKMATNPPEEVVNASFRVISIGKVYQYVGIGWVEEREATREDYQNIPEAL